ncbi:MAG TPA: glycosyltransferase, partial [Sphingobacteriaceae bacterium]
QDYKNIEILLRDDFSTDNSGDQIREFLAENQGLPDIRISVDLGRKNLGLIKSINRLLKQAKGQLIVCFATDDVIKSDRISYVVRKSLEHPEIDLFACDAEVIDRHGKRLKNTFYEFSEATFDGDIKSKNGTDYIFSAANYRFVSGFNFGGFGLAFRPRMLRDLSGQLPDTLHYEDYFLSFLGIVQGGAMFINMPLVEYRRTGSNLSSIKEISGDHVIAEEARFLHWTNSVETEKINFLKTGSLSGQIRPRKRLITLFLKQNVLINEIVISLANNEPRYKLVLELLWLTIIGPKRSICLTVILKSITHRTLKSYVIRSNQERRKWAF